MSLTRKRKRELKRLRSSAEELWEQQQQLLDRANDVAREIGRQVGHLTREEVAPRVRDRYEHYLQPSVHNARIMAKQAGHTLEKTVVPAVSGAVGTALSVADTAKEGGLKAALARFGAPAPAPKKSGPGMPTYIVGGFALAALAGLAYAVWQTFRADDELWVAEETATTGTPAPTQPAE